MSLSKKLSQNLIDLKSSSLKSHSSRSWTNFVSVLISIFIPGFPPEGQAKGCQECQDQEELRVHQIQGSMLPIPLHPRHQRQGEGREAEAIPASRSSSQRIEVKFLLEP